MKNWVAEGIASDVNDFIRQSHLAAQKEGVLTAIIFSNHKTFEPHLPNGSSRYVGACLITS